MQRYGEIWTANTEIGAGWDSSELRKLARWLVIGIKQEGSRARDNQSGAHFMETPTSSRERSPCGKSKAHILSESRIPNQKATSILSPGFTYRLHAIQKADTCSTQFKAFHQTTTRYCSIELFLGFQLCQILTQ